MSDEEQISHANYDMVTVDLIRSKASDKALLCFLAMGSFGAESRAKVASIAKRMRRAKEEAVREAQKELLDLGAIRLKKEATAQSPREWDIWPFPTEERGSEKRGASTRGASFGPPKQSKIQAPKEDQQPAPAGISFKRAVELFFQRWSAHMGEGNVYRLTPADRMNLARFLKEPISEASFDAVLKAYLASNDRFVASKGFPLMYLLTQWNGWAQMAKQPGRGQGGAPELSV